MKSVATIVTGEKEKERNVIPPAAGTKRHLCNWTSKKQGGDLDGARTVMLQEFEEFQGK